MVEVLVWSVPVAVAVAGAWNPRAGLLVLTACLPMFGSPPGGPYLGALEVAGLAAVATAWRAGRPERTPLGSAAAAFLLVGLLSLVPSPYVPPSWRPVDLVALAGAFPGVANWQALYTWRAGADLLLGWALFVAVRRAFDGRSLRPLALALLSGLVATLVVGLAAFGGLVSLDVYRPSPAFRSSHRLQSLFFLSGWLAMYIVVAAPFALSVVHRAGRRWRAVFLGLLGLSAAALALTLQRGAWVAAGAQVALVAGLTASRWRGDRALIRRAVVAGALVLTIGLVTVVAGGWIEPILERATSIRSGVVSRASLWTTATEMFVQKPWSGWGLGSFTPAFDLLHPAGSAGARLYRGTAHSLYLHVAAERGLAGLLALGLLGWATIAALRRARANGNAHALGLATSVAGVAIYGLVQYMFHLRNISWLFWILLGAIAVAAGPARNRRLERVAGVLVAVAVLATPIRLLSGDRPELAGNRTFGLHEIEGAPDQPFRWTEGLAVRRIPWAGETLTLSFANGHPAGAARPVTVTVRIEGEPAASFEVFGGWEEHAFDVGPPRSAELVVAIEARPTFRPFCDLARYPQLDERRRRSLDIRRLGVAILDPRWRHDPRTEFTDPAPSEHVD